MKMMEWLRSHPFWRMRRRIALWRATSLKKPFKRMVDGLELSTAEIGELGELLAVKFLRKHGRKPLSRNFARAEGGEVDVVARHGETLTFVEVKTRTKLGVHRPIDAVTRDKQHLIIRGARAWLQLLHDPRVPYRFDVVEVILIEGEAPQMNVVENAFQVEIERRR